jgi:hypothetical protein
MHLYYVFIHVGDHANLDQNDLQGRPEGDPL